MLLIVVLLLRLVLPVPSHLLQAPSVPRVLLLSSLQRLLPATSVLRLLPAPGPFAAALAAGTYQVFTIYLQIVCPISSFDHVPRDLVLIHLPRLPSLHWVPPIFWPRCLPLRVSSLLRMLWRLFMMPSQRIQGASQVFALGR